MANLVTLQQYKDFAGLSGVNTDARINTIIPQITQVVKTYCGTSLIDYYSSAKTEYFDILDRLTTRVMLDEGPIVAVTSVQERDSQSDSYVTVVVNMNI